MSWAARRRILYILGFLCITVTLISYPLYSFLKKPPTCFDGVQNGSESAIDKGGVCRLLDERSLIPLTVQWVRPFKTIGGLYNAVAYIENPNENAGVMSLKYELRLYDARNTLVATREGTTVVMPGSVTPVFEGRIETGTRVVTRAFLDVTEDPRWERMYDIARSFSIENKLISDQTTLPRLDAVAVNTTIHPVLKPAFVAVVFDTAGNAFAGSQTLIERIQPNERVPLSFTWNESWNFVVGRVDVLPLAQPTYSKR